MVGSANRYPPTPIRYHRHLVGAWFAAPFCGGGEGEALPLPETNDTVRFTVYGRTDATQSRPYLDWVTAVRGWRLVNAGGS